MLFGMVRTVERSVSSSAAAERPAAVRRCDQPVGASISPALIIRVQHTARHPDQVRCACQIEHLRHHRLPNVAPALHHHALGDCVPKSKCAEVPPPTTPRASWRSLPWLPGPAKTRAPEGPRAAAHVDSSASAGAPSGPCRRHLPALACHLLSCCSAVAYARAPVGTTIRTRKEGPAGSEHWQHCASRSTVAPALKLTTSIPATARAPARNHHHRQCRVHRDCRTVSPTRSRPRKLRWPGASRDQRSARSECTLPTLAPELVATSDTNLGAHTASRPEW